MAPEVHKCEPYNEQADIWSYGMTIIEMITLNLPYQNIPLLDVKEHIISGHLPDLETLPSRIPNNLQDFKTLFYNCTKQDPNIRFTAAQCLDLLRDMS